MAIAAATGIAGGMAAAGGAASLSSMLGIGSLALNAILGIGTLGLNQYNQMETWNREDTAHQRAVEDMRKAGLSPTLAAGSPASAGSPIRLSQPEIDLTKLLQIEMAEAQLDKVLAETEKTRAVTKFMEMEKPGKIRQEYSARELKLEQERLDNEIKGFIVKQEEYKTLMLEIDKKVKQHLMANGLLNNELESYRASVRARLITADLLRFKASHQYINEQWANITGMPAGTPITLTTLPIMIGNAIGKNAFNQKTGFSPYVEPVVE